MGVQRYEFSFCCHMKDNSNNVINIRDRLVDSLAATGSSLIANFNVSIVPV